MALGTPQPSVAPLAPSPSLGTAWGQTLQRWRRRRSRHGGTPPPEPARCRAARREREAAVSRGQRRAWPQDCCGAVPALPAAPGGERHLGGFRMFWDADPCCVRCCLWKSGSSGSPFPRPARRARSAFSPLTQSLFDKDCGISFSFSNKGPLCRLRSFLQLPSLEHVVPNYRARVPGGGMAGQPARRRRPRWSRLSVLPLVPEALPRCPAPHVPSSPPGVGRLSSVATTAGRDPRGSPARGEHGSGAGARAGRAWAFGGDTSVPISRAPRAARPARAGFAHSVYK